MELFIGYLKNSIRNSGGGGLKWHEYVRNRGRLVACVRVRTMGEGGSNFCHFGAYVLSE